MRKFLTSKGVFLIAAFAAAVLVFAIVPSSAYATETDQSSVTVSGTVDAYGNIVADAQNQSDSDEKTPVITTVTQAEWGVYVRWTKSAGAKGYSVYRKRYGVSGEKWKCIAKHVTTRSVIDKTVNSGTDYVYRVRAYFVKYETANANRYLSAYWSNASDTSDVGFWLQKPSSVKTKKVESGVKVTWSKVSGAESYVVCRKIPGKEEWTELATTSKKSFVDETAKSGVTYAYGVRAMKQGVTSRIKYTSFNAKYKGEKLRLYKEIVGCTSSTNYCISIDRRYNYLGVFKKQNGDWKLIKYWRCSTGKLETYTPGGTFSIYKKSKVFTSSPDTYYCYWYSAFNEKNGIHSVKYYPKSLTLKDGTLGEHVSNGCVRLAYDNAKWVYDNCDKGTTVRVFGSLEFYNTYDPYFPG